MSTSHIPSRTEIFRRGLTAEQIVASRAEHGDNLLTPPVRTPWWKLYLEKFRDPIIRILIIAAIIALLVGISDGEFIEGIGIIVAIILSTGLSFLNEHRAAREFDILTRAADEEQVQVVRDGKHQLIPKKDLVVGDIVLIERGAEIPADGKVLDAVSLGVNESSLTGESEPVTKKTGDDAADSGKAYPANLLLRGSTIADGHGIMEVAKVGDKTEIGKTARAAAETPDTMTPLARQLEKLAGVISIGAFAAAAVIFIAQTIRSAANGEIYDLTEQAGKLVRVPLSAGQWLCFAVLAIVAVILTAQIWAPSIRDGFKILGREDLLPKWLNQEGTTGFARLATVAAGVAGVALTIGLVTGLLKWSGPSWFPPHALNAFLRYFMLAVTVIVVAVPEGLPMCVALALAYSMRKMAASNNLVRKMHACETIGAASVICSDKTGTLTMNEMRVHKAAFPLLTDASAAAAKQMTERLVEAVAVNSTANLGEKNGIVEPIGNPTEGAILLWLNASGGDYEHARAAFRLARQLPFSTERKFMATAGISALDEKPWLYVKGAAEIVLKACDFEQTPDGDARMLDQDRRDEILQEAASYQNRGMRILGLAACEVNSAFLERDISPNMSGLTWNGFFVIADPIRPDVGVAIDRALAAGIQVKVVTGDNQATATEIGRQAGLWKDGDGPAQIIRGDDFEDLDDDAAADAAERIKIMSRARPMHKLKLVKALQSRGEVVAVTGDGTNDAPALNHADVGLSMGKTGTAVAKEAADIILLDDSFPSIVNAVAWGRSLYANIQKFIVFQLTINLAAVGIALLGPFLGVTLPLTVTQMLWVNLIMDTFAALALASEPPDWDLMKNPPRKSDAFIITLSMRNAICTVAAAFLVLFVAVMLFQRWLVLDPELPGGRHNLTIFFSAFVFLQFWNLWNARVFGTTHSAFYNLRQSRGFLLMAAIIFIGQILLVEFGGSMFRVTSLSFKEWAAIVILTSPVLWIGEAWRLHLRSSSHPDYWVYS